MFGEHSLRRGVHEFLIHYHRERNHQGLSNQLIAPDPSAAGRGPIRRQERLGGLLNYYSRDAA
jgi:putative transposase